jgi:hypothetical protein
VITGRFFICVVWGFIWGVFEVGLGLVFARDFSLYRYCFILLFLGVLC